SFRFEVTNVVGCRPTKIGKYGAITNRAPTEQEITACNPRLSVLGPFDGIVYLGLLARTGQPGLNLTHPAAILRKEYKLYDLKKEAKKLDNYVNSLHEARRET